MTDAAWALLDLAPTRDAAAIRRAYARRLKQTRPDDDPEGFQALLAARDRALAEARRDPPDEPAEPGDDAPPVPEPAAAFSPAAAPEPAPEVIAAPVVRDLDPQVEDVTPPEPPSPVVVDVAPLEAGGADWAQAFHLAEHLPPLDRGAGDDLADWLARARRLPHEPRRDLEAALLQALFAAWREPDGRLTARRVAATRPALLLAAPVFGWPREDAVLAASLPPGDAALAVQVMRDVLPPDPDDPATVLVWAGPGTRLPLGSGDARAFLDGHPRALAVYEALRRRAPVPRRVPVLALLAPHLWAIAHRRWGTALAVLSGLWLSFGLSVLATEGEVEGVAAGVVGLLALAVWIGTAGATAWWADRILVGGAARAARRAGRKGVYAPGERAARLRKASVPIGIWNWLLLAWFGAFPLLFPYAGLISLADRLARGR
ncbi:hypothetical protein [Methylobacterium oryzihabitans]|uniref:J domain-containing protein n=1 Tax=Methylobacterium oryzihabitans TaxID=2499852 RepID=A0A437NXF1_9HYPH|nr:hypothetical protein [Methylobacterium oryzihabitans]RVU14675.1 hypothetical protein EOE48_22495 [Methylobacterium oryzihabitans]